MYLTDIFSIFFSFVCHGFASTQELGLFPIAALLEVGTSNLNRVELIWSPITSHLSEVRRGVRVERSEWGVGDQLCRGTK